MANEYNNKTHIKTLLFTKAIPNYKIPVPLYGHKLYRCTDCEDRYIVESSYHYHVNRKSVKITYKCRHCGLIKIFYNRCNLLSHIRSHAFKTTTINIGDLNVEPLLPSSEVVPKNIQNQPQKTILRNYICFECKADDTKTGIAYKDRVAHYMHLSNAILYTCPICMFTLPTTCALKAHLRLHLKHPPFFCPECGITLQNKCVEYPYTHDCEGFKMMRATARISCSAKNCHVFHPNEYNEHMTSLHLKKMYKCPACAMCGYNEDEMQQHLKVHNYGLIPVILYECTECNGKLLVDTQVTKHLASHVNTFVYPCWSCGKIFNLPSNLISHHMCNHLKEINISHQLQEKYRNTYKSILSIRTPVCTKKKNSINSIILHEKDDNINLIKCHLCKKLMSQNWENIKTHYKRFHKNYKCVDIKVVLEKLDEDSIKVNSKKLECKNEKIVEVNEENIAHLSRNKSGKCSKISKNISNYLACKKCDYQCNDKESLEIHLREHKDPYMAYQCLECGQSFAVKPSFSTHLLLEHDISDVIDYISKKQCYNENALVAKHCRSDNNDENEPLKEHQCKICREQFDNADNLEKHFRVHGMAFLMKNTNKGNHT
ncbi:PREDICTED: zinc finger protein 687-like isoform X2 [Papilio xuthus]|nr:PREDICTED: zinc finger protein 687-like isoform X2 [Papilio xuthus]XP_013177418.1 PREDICTED: zinc finger protein 687-like isoform X2 [Papilio xuthus]XP_013177419.1 PREDICTED: zinc finger protein 687-like isoform X2 [Papilio xuthus]